MVWSRLLACVSPEESAAPGESGADTAVDSGDPSDSGGGDLLALTDANNYRYTGILDGPTIRTAELTDLHIDWSALSLDLQCHGLDPVADIDNLALLPFPYLSEVEVEAGLSAGDLQQADLGGYVSIEVEDRTDVYLSELTFFGTDADIETLYAEGSATWLLVLSTGTTIGVGTRSLLFLEPHADEAATEVIIGDACGILDFDADLGSLTPVPVPRVGPWNVGWGGLTVDGQGGALERGNIDRLMVGVYPGMTPADLAASFLDLDRIAEGLWTWDVGGSASLDLGTAPMEGGAFPGFDQEGTWILALRCTMCANPAPLFLTVLEPG